MIQYEIEAISIHDEKAKLYWNGFFDRTAAYDKNSIVYNYQFHRDLVNVDAKENGFVNEYVLFLFKLTGFKFKELVGFLPIVEFEDYAYTTLSSFSNYKPPCYYIDPIIKHIESRGLSFYMSEIDCEYLYSDKFISSCKQFVDLRNYDDIAMYYCDLRVKKAREILQIVDVKNADLEYAVTDELDLEDDEYQALKAKYFLSQPEGEDSYSLRDFGIYEKILATKSSDKKQIVKVYNAEGNLIAVYATMETGFNVVNAIFCIKDPAEYSRNLSVYCIAKSLELNLGKWYSLGEIDEDDKRQVYKYKFINSNRFTLKVHL